MRLDNQNIWIIGASSGIGYKLAEELSHLGANLILSARREDTLKKLQQQLGKNHKTYPCDVSKYEDIKAICSEIKQNNIILDRVIFMPAIYEPNMIADMDITFASYMIDVNIKGALYLIKEILPIFEKQKSGQIVLCGSVAGYIGLPNGQPYSATKAAIVNFAESLYTETPRYIDIKLISPGFVTTPMTEKNNFDMPMIISADKAAKAIIKDLDKDIFEIHFPKKFTYFLKILAVLPYKIALFITKKMTNI